MGAMALGRVRNTGNKKLDRVLKKLEGYDFSPVTSSCVQRYGWSRKKGVETEIEVKRFFSLAFLDPGHYHIPAPDVDEYWHRMILHTKWYMEFCLAIFGQYYHHTPEPDRKLISKKNRERSLGLMQHWYGYTWDSLVDTCTQCKGPITGGGSIFDLAPSAKALYKP